MENFDRIMNVNTKGMMLCVRAELAAMRKQSPKKYKSRNGTRDIGRGAIVNIASANSFTGLPGKMSYTVSKHACIGLTKMSGEHVVASPNKASTNRDNSGLDHAAEGIRCNAVCPTWVRTPLLDLEMEKNPEVQDMISAIVPLKRAAECEEVADTVAYLCSPAASYINGTSIIIDAGVTTTVRLF